ncbi:MULTISPECIES: hypothetical protein [unclassified Archaeoglobus]|jgi:predicted metal-binding protein|uniref:hypothetical protein n=1 Tax=unclassified Archaeoglobus TaxID=2643606 RepID=UPI0025BEECE8|nr:MULTISPECIES: hypothetical protein [unclassified Archaeoglobus]
MKKREALSGYDELNVVGFASCGGCPGLVILKMKLFLMSAKLGGTTTPLIPALKQQWKLKIAQSDKLNSQS